MKERVGVPIRIEEDALKGIEISNRERLRDLKNVPNPARTLNGRDCAVSDSHNHLLKSIVNVVTSNFHWVLFL
jgi:hypothetical protein